MRKKTIYLPCECPGGKKECGYAMFIFYDDFDLVEIGWAKNKKSRMKNGVVISNKIFKKLMKNYHKSI